ncbi:hypothetical protein [Amycolatopsis sp. FDAARGOS 1241]|uniref:hypothetical protein n=1 Tax=Amycolatopsis sp. FDAARGOS 1241 TaxID=2778070 RepID=UPI001952213E|nr:hypothetical protein [Amycolatopsis sp. FDAARGOS 1241]QRP47178.1 hypothetical protein I6J71_03955 [Amycolatopsis sp. FDAARGOS 1241]
MPTRSGPEQLVQTVCDAAAQAAPPGWRRITLRVWGTVVAYQAELEVVLADGSRPAVPPPAITHLLMPLREQMYQPGRGTWLSARFELRAGEPPTAAFNYDDDPQWWPELPPAAFVRELQAFPRTEDHVRPWLRQALADAAASAPEAGG